MVHADLKPENIMVEFNDKEFTKIKLIDFGSSFSLDDIGMIGATTNEYFLLFQMKIFILKYSLILNMLK